MKGQNCWIVFDAFGTLFHFKQPVIGKTYYDFYMRHIQPYSNQHHNKSILSPADIQTRFHSAFKRIQLQYPNYGACSLTTFQWWNFVLSHTFNHDCTGRYEEMYKALFDYYKQADAYECHSETHVALKQLSDDGYKLGVLSNCDDRLNNILDNLKLLKYFNLTMDSKTVNCQKPDPRIFICFKMRAASGGGEKFVYIGNDMILDYEASLNAGWDNAILLLSSQKPQRGERMKEKKNVIARINAGEIRNLIG